MYDQLDLGEVFNFKMQITIKEHLIFREFWSKELHCKKTIQKKTLMFEH
jgi:hypothetical protein